MSFLDAHLVTTDVPAIFPSFIVLLLVRRSPSSVGIIWSLFLIGDTTKVILSTVVVFLPSSLALHKSKILDQCSILNTEFV